VEERIVDFELTSLGQPIPTEFVCVEPTSLLLKPESDRSNYHQAYNSLSILKIEMWRGTNLPFNSIVRG
jgi:hypothetical protein